MNASVKCRYGDFVVRRFCLDGIQHAGGGSSCTGHTAKSVSRKLALSAQVLERIAEEIDPEGTGLSFDDFLSIVSRMPDFITNFRMAV